jgi:predicted dehydrogenase
MERPVLCEKPFTVNQREAEVLITLAKEHKVFLMEGMWTKFLPVTRMVKQWIDENRIGKVKYLQASFGFCSEFNPKSRLYDPHLAGGALLDVGVYPISYAAFLLGKLPDQVKSSAYIGDSKVDEMNVIAMHFEDGTLADLSSAISANTGNDAVIIGEKGKSLFRPSGRRKKQYYLMRPEIWLRHFLCRSHQTVLSMKWRR